MKNDGWNRLQIVILSFLHTVRQQRRDRRPVKSNAFGSRFFFCIYFFLRPFCVAHRNRSRHHLFTPIEMCLCFRFPRSNKLMSHPPSSHNRNQTHAPSPHPQRFSGQRTMQQLSLVFLLGCQRMSCSILLITRFFIVVVNPSSPDES